MSLIIDPYRFGAADTFIMPYRQDVMAWSSVDGSGGMTYTRYQAGVLLSLGLARQNGTGDADNGDYMEWSVNLAAGTYTMTVVWYRDTTCGIVEAFVDATSLGTFDMYGSAAANQVTTFTGITVAADGNYTVKLAVNGKNASSSDYLMAPTSVTMHRSGS